MAVHSVSIASTARDAEGNSTTSISSEIINAHRGDNYVSSEDFKDGGAVVRDGKGNLKSVYTASDLSPDDVVTVAGIPMTVAQGKSVGYQFDDTTEPIKPGSVDAAQSEEDEAPPIDTRQE